MKKIKKILLTTCINAAFFTTCLAVSDNIYWGDLNNDDKINSTDAAIALMQYANNSADEEMLGDMNKDGKINSTDAAMMLQLYSEGTAVHTSEIKIIMSESNTAKLYAYEAQKNSETFRFTSEDETIASVDENGVITAIAEGETYISVLATNSQKERKCRVIVEQGEIIIPTTSISLDKQSASLDMNAIDEVQLIATKAPVDSTDRIMWTSSNENVAVVDNNGLVKAVGNGTTTIEVSNGKGIKSSCEVVVKSTFAPSIKLSDDGTVITISDSTGIASAILYRKVDGSWKNQNVTMTSIDDNTKTIPVSTLTSTKQQYKLVVKDGAGNTMTECMTLKVGGRDRGPRIYCTSSRLNEAGNAMVGNVDIRAEDNAGITSFVIYDTSITENPENLDKKFTSQVSEIGDGYATASLTVGPNEKKIYYVKAIDPTSNPASERIVVYGENYNECTIVKGQTQTIDINGKTDFKVENPVVAEIDSQTGVITAKQMGTTEITYNENGVLKTYRVYVKIGNTPMDLSVLSSNTAVGSGSGQVTVYGPNNYKNYITQDLDITSKFLYFSEENHGPLQAIVQYNIKTGTQKETGVMNLNLFGHGQGFAMEEADDGDYVWSPSVASQRTVRGYTASFGISRILFENGKKYNYFGGTTFVLSKPGVNIDWSKPQDKTTLHRGLQVSIDKKNGLLGIYVGTKPHTVYVYDLATVEDYLNTMTLHENVTITGLDELDDPSLVTEMPKSVTLDVYDLGELKELCVIPIFTAESKQMSGIDDLLKSIEDKGSLQGVTMDGDYVYLLQGVAATDSISDGDNYAFVTRFYFKYGPDNGYAVSSGPTRIKSIRDGQAVYNKLIANTSYKYVEPEGIKIRNGKIYIGTYMIGNTKQDPRKKEGGILRFNP